MPTLASALAAPLLVERRDRTVFVTLNRPAAANALSRALVAELTKVCGELERELGEAPTFGRSC